MFHDQPTPNPAIRRRVAELHAAHERWWDWMGRHERRSNSIPSGHPVQPIQRGSRRQFDDYIHDTARPWN